MSDNSGFGYSSDDKINQMYIGDKPVAGINFGKNKVKIQLGDLEIPDYSWIKEVSFTNSDKDSVFYSSASNIWTDGKNIYYCNGIEGTCVYDKDSMSWSEVDYFNINLPGTQIWHYGDNTYYSYGDTQYVLDVDSHTWTEKTWSGLTSFYRSGIWVKGTKVFYSYGSEQYEADIDSSTWTAVTWSGLSSFYGYVVWTDGTNAFYSNLSYGQYILDTDNYTAEEIPVYVDGVSSTSGVVSVGVWNNGNDIFLSYGHYQYILDKEKTNSNGIYWKTKEWRMKYDSNGTIRKVYFYIHEVDSTANVYKYIWNDGTNYYYSEGNCQCKFIF